MSQYAKASNAVQKAGKIQKLRNFRKILLEEKLDSVSEYGFCHLYHSEDYLWYMMWVSTEDTSLALATTNAGKSWTLYELITKEKYPGSEEVTSVFGKTYWNGKSFGASFKEALLESFGNLQNNDTQYNDGTQCS